VETKVVEGKSLKGVWSTGVPFCNSHQKHIAPFLLQNSSLFKHTCISYLLHFSGHIIASEILAFNHWFC